MYVILEKWFDEKITGGTFSEDSHVSTPITTVNKIINAVKKLKKNTVK